MSVVGRRPSVVAWRRVPPREAAALGDGIGEESVGWTPGLRLGVFTRGISAWCREDVRRGRLSVEYTVSALAARSSRDGAVREVASVEVVVAAPLLARGQRRGSGAFGLFAVFVSATTAVAACLPSSAWVTVSCSPSPDDGENCRRSVAAAMAGAALALFWRRLSMLSSAAVAAGSAGPLRLSIVTAGPAWPAGVLPLA